MKIRYSLLGAVLLLGGCVQTAEVQSSFVPANYAFALKKGRADVRGWGLLHRAGGAVVYDAGSTVLLIPATPYTAELERMNKAGQWPKRLDPRLSGYVRKTRADGKGRFIFRNVPAGTYFVNSTVAGTAGEGQRDVALSKKIMVTGKRDVDIVLTK